MDDDDPSLDADWDLSKEVMFTLDEVELVLFEAELEFPITVTCSVYAVNFGEGLESVIEIWIW